MEVRLARSEDIPGVCAILDHEIKEGFAHFGTEPVCPEEYEREWLAIRERYPLVVADIEDKIVGFAKASPWKARGAYKFTAEIGVYIRPENQRQGAARALYDFLIPELRRIGFHTLLAGVALPNEPSVKLHESYGMWHIGTQPEVGFKFGRWHDVGYWALILD